MTVPQMGTEDVACPMGCAKADEVLFVARERFHDLPGRFPVVRCRTCDLIRTNPRPTPDAMGQFYPEDYSPFQTSQVATPTIARAETGRLASLMRAFSRRVIRFNTEMVPTLTPGQMLEVGCASGGFMATMQDRNWQVSGIEFSQAAAANARAAGFEVQRAAIEDAEAPSTKPSLVVGWMVLEHMHDPVHALRKLANWSEQNAWLTVSTPNAASLDFPLFRSSGYALQVPNHLYHFTPKTIRALLERSGWEVKKVHHQRLLGNYLGSAGFLLEDLGAPRRLSKFFVDLPARPGKLHLALYPLAWLLSLFGQTGRMTVWAQKKDCPQRLPKHD